MEYIALYRKWRPLTFDEVVEQESTVTILKNTVKSGRIGHAYLFSGTRGTGKTSVAKIFARAINCENPVDGNPCNQCPICKGILSDSMLDVAEVDAASNNGVDAIRDIIDVSSYRASLAKYKVFIIDEVHMLSVSAFNALLKTLEEPPERVVFILATTEPQKIPVTILSRCQRYEFKRISRDGIVARLEEICEKTGLEYETGALRLIAGRADGGLRDAISMLDQTIAYSEGRITLRDARKASGAIDSEVLEDFTGALLARDSFKILTVTDDIFAAGIDPSNFIGEIIGMMRSLMICSSTRNPKQFLLEDDKGIERLKKLASYTNTKEITMFIKELSALESKLKWSIQRKIVFEAGMLSLCERTWSRESEITDRVETLEKGVADLVNNGLKLAPGQIVTAPVSVEANEPKHSLPEKAAEEPANEPEIPEEQPLTRDVLASLEPVEKAIQKEYIGAVGVPFPGTASVLTTRVENLYVIGKTLYIPLEDGRDFPMVTEGKRKAALENAAMQVFKTKLRVRVIAKTEFFEQAPDLILKPEDAENEKGDAEKIADYAASNGIDFSYEGAGKDETVAGGTVETAIFDTEGFEPNGDYYEEGDAYGDDEDADDDEAPETRTVSFSEDDDGPAVTPKADGDQDDFFDGGSGSSGDDDSMYEDDD